jgi:hypothetical protein
VNGNYRKMVLTGTMGGRFTVFQMDQQQINEILCWCVLGGVGKIRLAGSS